MRLITCVIDEGGYHMRVFHPPDALHLYVVRPAATVRELESRRMLEEIREQLAALVM